MCVCICIYIFLYIYIYIYICIYNIYLFPPCVLIVISRDGNLRSNSGLRSKERKEGRYEGRNGRALQRKETEGPKEAREGRTDGYCE